MNFAELRFWEILVVALAILLGVRLTVARREETRSVYDRAALLALGLSLLLAVSWKTFVIFVTVSVATYAGVAAILRWLPMRRGLGLAILVPVQLAPLLYYKYADFVANRILGFHFSALHDLLIPVGISFYTFQKIAFACDTLSFGKPLPAPLNFMNFAGFFPQIVAGPIERRDELLPQLEGFRFRWSAENLNTGASWIALGMFFKRCLADNLAAFFHSSSLDNAWAIWAANILFGLRIYYDFAGYSLIAVGLAKCLGVRLTQNFASPYCSRSVSEFWRRWHITLSQWLRDYIYIPLGGGRARNWMLNIALVFLISGIWHGAGWNFAAWGALHAAFLIVQRLAANRVRLPHILGWPATMAAVFFAWLSFYETDPSRLSHKFATLLRPSAYSIRNLRMLPEQWSFAEQFAIACFGLLTLAIFFLEWRSLIRTGEPYSDLRRGPVLAVLVVLTVLLAPGEENAFIYFAF